MLASKLLRQQARQWTPKSTAIPPRSLFSPTTRQFHATAPRKDVSEALLSLPHEMLQYMHVSMPWYAVLPVSAFIMRGLLVTTVGRHLRSLTTRYLALSPLRTVVAKQARESLMRKGGFENPAAATKAVTKAAKSKAKELDRRWNCTLWGQLGLSIVQLPIFLTMAEIIRRMSNMRVGLLGMAVNVFGLGPKPEAGTLVGEEVTSVAIPRYDETHTMSIMEADGARIEGDSGIASLVFENPWFEPSLATEGMLWFPNLLLPDPTGTLPYIVSALMFTNIYSTGRSDRGQQRMPRGNRYLRNFMLGVSLAMGPLCQDIPAALMLYWAGSTASVMAWNLWLNRKYPVPVGFGACKRPLVLPPSRTRRF